MNGERVLHTIATELPGILAQLQSDDLVLRSAGLMRLHDFCKMTERWKGKTISRRQLVHYGVATFVGLSIKQDD